MFVKIKEQGVLIPCDRGLDGKFVEEGMSLEDAFKAHGKWINPMRDPTQATETDATVELGVRALDFEGSGLKNGAVRKLAHILRVNTTVTRLNLSWNEIGSKGATYLADSLVKNCTLTHLDLSHNEIEDAGARQLAFSLGGHASALREHGISGAKKWYQLDKTFVPAGEGNIKLRSLSLQCNPIEEEGRRELLAAIAYNGGLKTVSLGGSIMMGRDPILLGEALWCNWNITSLDLSAAGISTDAAIELAKVISRPHGTLQTLNLSRNRLGDDGTTALVNSLKPIQLEDDADTCSPILITEPRHNKMGPEIAQPSLTSLDLSDNNIGQKGMMALADALHTNASLATLILSDNRCGDEGATVLAKSLVRNRGIQSIFFYDNTIQLDAVGEISYILKEAPMGQGMIRNAVETAPVLSSLSFKQPETHDSGAMEDNVLDDDCTDQLMP